MMAPPPDDYGSRHDGAGQRDVPVVTPLEAVYDEATLRAIDGAPFRRRNVEPPNLVRRAAVNGAMVTALVTGVRDVFEPEDADVAFEEVDDGVVGGPNAPVTLFFVPHNPQATVAIVRPWLFPPA